MVARIDNNTEQKIVGLYNDGYGTMCLSHMFDLNRATIQRIMKRNKIGLRKITPSYKYDEYFFSSYTRESCYWAGFIAADGCIRSDRDTLHIKLASKDKQHLFKFLKVIRSENNVNEGTNGPDKYSFIDVSGKPYVYDLKKNFCITPQKSLTLRFPDNVPIELVPDFIRGYFDGDGSISKSHKINVEEINFVGTEDFLDFLRNYFYYCVGIRIKSGNRVPPLFHSGNVCSISYSGINAMKILNKLYDDSYEDVRLDRKYERYLSYLEADKKI